MGRSDDTALVERFGEAMAAVHKAGYALGDSKATNIIIQEDGGLCFTDLEQASEGGDQGWDIAAFLYYQAKLSFKEVGMKKVAGAFLRGYGESNGPENIAKAKSTKYITPFRPLSAPQMLKVVRESLEAQSR